MTLLLGFLACAFLMLLGRELLASWEPRTFVGGVLALVVLPAVVVLLGVLGAVLGLG